jgi:hypothetical protein
LGQFITTNNGSNFSFNTASPSTGSTTLNLGAKTDLTMAGSNFTWHPPTTPSSTGLFLVDSGFTYDASTNSSDVFRVNTLGQINLTGTFGLSGSGSWSGGNISISGGVAQRLDLEGGIVQSNSPWKLTGITSGTCANVLGLDSSFHVVTTGCAPATYTASNTDLAGTLTLSSGSASYSFTGTYASSPICTTSDVTALNPTKPVATTTTLTVTGTGTDVVNYICIARN